MSGEIAPRTGSEMDQQRWSVADMIVAFTDGTDEQRQAMANAHSTVVRKNGRMLDVTGETVFTPEDGTVRHIPGRQA